MVEVKQILHQNKFSLSPQAESELLTSVSEFIMKLCLVSNHQLKLDFHSAYILLTQCPFEIFLLDRVHLATYPIPLFWPKSLENKEK